MSCPAQNKKPSAESVARKLSEETEFCKNYLLLEKSRLNGGNGNAHFLTEPADWNQTAKTLTDALNKVKPVKRFDANKHLGKVKWDEDPLEFQKRLRNEWG